MAIVDQIYSQYGERPQQTRIEAEGNAYLTSQFPRLSYVRRTVATGSPPSFSARSGRNSNVWLVWAGIVLIVTICCKYASRESKDAHVIQSTRQVDTLSDYGYDSENEGARLLGCDEAPPWDPDFRPPESRTGRQVSRPAGRSPSSLSDGSVAAAGVM